MDTPMTSPPTIPVLLVDDEEAIRESLRFFLEEEGYPVAETASVADALTHLRNAALPHVVLLDFLMPAGNAETLLREAEQDATLQRHRYILMPASEVARFSDEA